MAQVVQKVDIVLISGQISIQWIVQLVSLILTQLDKFVTDAGRQFQILGPW